MNSASTLTASRITPPSPFTSALNKANDKGRTAEQESEAEESSVAQTTAILRPPQR